MRLLGILGVSTALLVPSLVRAGDVRGTLWVSHAAAAHAPADPRPGGAAVAAEVRSQRGVGDAVVWLVDVPDKVERKLAAPPHHWFWQHPRPERLPCVVQRDHQFVPHVLAVPSGGAVEFRNLDRIYHNVFSVSAARPFDLGKYPPGRADTVTFRRPGVVNLHCDIHPDELGFVVVVPNHACARPDSLGAFQLPKLPPGHYEVHAWHPRLGELKYAFDVPRRGDVTLRLVF